MTSLRIREIQLYERDVRFRLPFRYGIVTLTEAPQAFLHVRIELPGGGGAWGCGAEMLSPKWFDKNPRLTNQENFEQLRASIRTAASAYLSCTEFRSAFEHFESNYQAHRSACERLGLNGLVAGFGPALIDRAVLDALFRSVGLTFWEGMKANLPGIDPVRLAPDLNGFEMSSFLASLSSSFTLHARHTVGLVDPIRRGDLRPSERLDDGLPETLEEVLDVYQPTFFKVKVNGRLNEDLERLARVAEVLDQLAEPYSVSLDGNEQYRGLLDVEELWNKMEELPLLRRFLDSIIFIEQPITRTHALDEDITSLSSRRPVIIDESDESLGSFPAARAKGYRGVSSKICKGLYKSLINAARCRHWNREAGQERYFMTGEDLSIQAGVALQQDLALASLLGLTHLERNGHHYVHGFSGVSEVEQSGFLAHHPDLYLRKGQTVCVRIREGQLDFQSLNVPGFASGVEPDWGQMTRMPL